MFPPKYLIGFLGVTTVDGGITASTLLSRKTDNSEEKRDIFEVSQKEKQSPLTISPTPALKEEPPKLSFSGKLVFSKDNNLTGPEKTADISYSGKIFDNKEYKEEKDEDDPEKYITVEVNLQKSQEEIEIELDKLNEKIKNESKKRKNQGTNLNIFEKVLKNLKEEFKKHLGDKTYEDLLKKIESLKLPGK